jgi:hypothetical protein
MDCYNFNLRNLDIGVAPLEPTIFNMSKSDLKAMEYASWGVVPVLPNYITYSRFWTPGKNCLMYRNNEELYKCIEFLITHHAERESLARAARQYVADHRLQKYDSERRYNFYKSLIDSKKKPVLLKPQKGEI